MSASVSGNPGGTPSTMHPTPLQWDSPKVVTRKRVPNVLIVDVEFRIHQEEKFFKNQIIGPVCDCFQSDSRNITGIDLHTNLLYVYKYKAASNDLMKFRVLIEPSNLKELARRHRQTRRQPSVDGPRLPIDIGRSVASEEHGNAGNLAKKSITSRAMYQEKSTNEKY